MYQGLACICNSMQLFLRWNVRKIRRSRENIRTVQTANNIKYSDGLAAGLGAVSLDVEMETGTGKTYVSWNPVNLYLCTIKPCNI